MLPLGNSERHRSRSVDAKKEMNVNYSRTNTDTHVLRMHLCIRYTCMYVCMRMYAHKLALGDRQPKAVGNRRRDAAGEGGEGGSIAAITLRIRHIGRMKEAVAYRRRICIGATKIR